MKYEPVRPEYYSPHKFEVLDYIEAFALPFHVGNAVKYLCRAGHKPGANYISDVMKAVTYVDMCIQKDVFQAYERGEARFNYRNVLKPYGPNDILESRYSITYDDDDDLDIPNIPARKWAEEFAQYHSGSNPFIYNMLLYINHYVFAENRLEAYIALRDAFEFAKGYEFEGVTYESKS